MHLSSASPGRWGVGERRADVGTLRIVHFKVLVFPHPRGIFFRKVCLWQSKQPTGFRTLFWFFEQLANTRTLHTDEN